MKNPKNYKAFSLFEIVVSIVVLGIIAATFPLILQSVTQTAKNVTKEEIVLNEMSLMSMILQYYFDENNTIGDNFYKDLNASGSNSNALLIKYYSPYIGYARIGKKAFNNNVLRSGSSLDVSDIGIDTNKGEINNNISTYNDIDDFDGYSQVINDVNLSVSVDYIDDNTTYSDENISFGYNYLTKSKNSKTNIKLITIISDNNITLSYPTCNIGASKFLSLEDLSR
jgi:type II secretory pathway pseudopilin PulG